MPNLDANFNTEVLRRDAPNIIACARSQALFLGVRLAYNASGIAAGTVLARNTVNGLYYPYADSPGTSGLGVAACVLETPVKATDFPSTAADIISNSVLMPAIFRGAVFYSKLVGIDAAGITDLGGRKVTDVVSTTDILLF